MDLVDNIQNNFNRGYYNKAMVIESLPTEFPAWTIKNERWFGVALVVDANLDFIERFSSAMLWTTYAEIENENYKLLVFSCVEEELRNEFAIICGQFVDPGEAGIARKEIVGNPQKWWNRWKGLLGNAISSNEAYSVLGEMITYAYLMENGYKAVWTGIDGGTKDIETQLEDFEVKSTVKRYDYLISVSSKYQMNSEAKKLNLIFCRFEKSSFGICINDLVDRLVLSGENEEKINIKLQSCGFEIGAVARSIKYNLLEMKKYPVNEKFPAITDKSFIGGQIPVNVVKIVYTVDLVGIESENII